MKKTGWGQKDMKRKQSKKYNKCGKYCGILSTFFKVTSLFVLGKRLKLPLNVKAGRTTLGKVLNTMKWEKTNTQICKKTDWNEKYRQNTEYIRVKAATVKLIMAERRSQMQKSEWDASDTNVKNEYCIKNEVRVRSANLLGM